MARCTHFVMLRTIRSQIGYIALHWRHNERDGISNHQPHECLLNRLFRGRSKETSKLRVTGLCVGNSPVTSEFPSQRASNAENVSICWRHHGVPGWGYGDILLAVTRYSTRKGQLPSLSLAYGINCPLIKSNNSILETRRWFINPALYLANTRWPENSPNKWPVTRKMFPFDDKIR